MFSLECLAIVSRWLRLVLLRYLSHGLKITPWVLQIDGIQWDSWEQVHSLTFEVSDNLWLIKQNTLSFEQENVIES